MSQEPFLSIVIPVYNEERRIGEGLRRVTAFLSLQKYPAEIIVSDDGSVDKTVQVVETFAASHPDVLIQTLKAPRNRGKGAVVRDGMTQARGRYLLLTDADLSSPIKEVDKLIRVLEKGADIAVGSRALRAPGCDVRQSKLRHTTGRIFSFLTRALVLDGILDTQCGFKLFRADTTKVIFKEQTIERFSFDIELLYLAAKKGLKIKEVPVMWKEEPGTRVHFIKDPMNMVRDLFYLRKLYSIRKPLKVVDAAV
ncbi:MAG TPA: dolichyl-phosphate beta-glucosyltransferase [Candidatus Omnitrophota bacterium]|nr:dolichyl-phosphate beta-glucosyltransferase [Candidatus Omnitrophota bacterium]